MRHALIALIAGGALAAAAVPALAQSYDANTAQRDWQVRDLNSRLSLLSSRVNYDVNEGEDTGD